MNNTKSTLQPQCRDPPERKPPMNHTKGAPIKPKITSLANPQGADETPITTYVPWPKPAANKPRKAKAPPNPMPIAPDASISGIWRNIVIRFTPKVHFHLPCRGAETHPSDRNSGPSPYFIKAPRPPGVKRYSAFLRNLLRCPTRHRNRRSHRSPQPMKAHEKRLESVHSQLMNLAPSASRRDGYQCVFKA
jgi:hypothetical protein